MEFKSITNILDQECDILVLGMYEGDKETSQEIVNEYALAQDDFEGKFLDTYLLPTYGKSTAKKILVVGLGKKDEFTPNKSRELSAKVVKKLASLKAKTATFDLPCQGLEKYIVEGALIGEYKFDKYKSDKKPNTLETIYLSGNELKILLGVKLAEAMKFARDLANEPAEYATPSKLAEIAESFGLETKIYDKKAIEEMKMGAFLAVGKGSTQEPKFIHLKYTCQNPQKKIAIIGKGITFDSGGLDIKPASSMLTMKDDMSGAACVLGLMSKIKEFTPNIEVHGIIAACENMPGCSAYKPGDILTAKNGKTIEVDNTDAEGRLTLADALCYASELEVDEIIDVATLTGACMVALGTQAAGIMGNDQKLIDSLIKTAETAGERYWQLPMYEEYKDSLKSDIADMKNTGSRWGGASTAGLFLKNFVKEDKKWAHIDIAGVAFLDSPQKEFIKGATGAGVRALLNYILNN